MSIHRLYKKCYRLVDKLQELKDISKNLSTALEAAIEDAVILLKRLTVLIIRRLRRENSDLTEMLRETGYVLLTMFADLLRRLLLTVMQVVLRLFRHFCFILFPRPPNIPLEIWRI